ncbi:heat-shock protein [Elstera cyanobacteriorum]|uniref:Heat-shock protein n=1 Tax=Elstera cyanobacteriorum TaxID=2022747 RepID=A0A255XPS5_9PROT|nr:Hsp70 family protein [Elstera cyanobacteriorum]OYQ18455.1 hypothetical protein CHR90_09205 [Elstera cyanobacteriorum]GFZ80158.1 heat-shock protein [Elstera cyanobacteriorum]
MMAAGGLDFGTSNSALAIVRNGTASLLPLEPGARTIPSALFFQSEDKSIEIGSAATQAYLEGEPGRLMRSLKSALGTSLIQEETLANGRRWRFTEIIGLYLRTVKARAEAALEEEIDQLVHGRPVHFVNGDAAADAEAQRVLESIAHSVGFKDVVFQYEPIAAALAFERQIARETLILIADIGGGTSDFSIVRARPERSSTADQAGDILANGGLRLGGTDLDRLLSLAEVMPSLGYHQPLLRNGLTPPNWIYSKLATWAEIGFLYDPALTRDVVRMVGEASDAAPLNRLHRVLDQRDGHRLAASVEGAKIGLSSAPTYDLALDFLEAGFHLPLTVEALEAALADAEAALTAEVRRCIDLAGVKGQDIEAVILTGGSSLMPLVQRAIAAGVPEAKLTPFDAFGGVAAGLAWQAKLLFDA